MKDLVSMGMEDLEGPRLTALEGRPKRIQRKRTKGWKMPPNAVYVGRPTMFGNHAGTALNAMSRPHMVNLFRQWVEGTASKAWKDHVRKELRGKDLACWCPLDQPCHADVLLELANAQGSEAAGSSPSPNGDS